jgi:D-3-phosphoglycerate dehydrogenase / 2-oxoglutarate reductase
MIKLLANDGIDATGKKMLEQAGFDVITSKIEQADLADYINKNNISALTVRSATKVRKDLIDICPGLKLIGRGGVGMDNIDVEYAREKGIEVINTPAASSQSVAELVIAHMFSMVRFLHESNREMPVNGNIEFNNLKKKYSEGIELNGKSIGIIGFGRIGQCLAKYALGLGMRVFAYDPFIENAIIKIDFFDGTSKEFQITSKPINDFISQCDFISLHVPGGEILGEKEINLLKDGAMLINAARGGVINETALLNALNNGKVACAALDVFTNEPTPDTALLTHPKISLTPHTGASTKEAQNRIGVELAEKIIAFFKA